MRFVASTIPSALSISRVPLAALFVLTFDAHDTRRFWASIGIVAIALATDIADGRLARSLNTATVTGYLLDGLGDKVFYAAILIVIARESPSHLVLVWALIGRELVLYGIRAIDPRNDKNRMHLRHISVFYAVIIRIYFLGFFIQCGMAVYGYHTPVGDYYFLAAIGAIAGGWFQIVSLAKVILIDLEDSYEHRG